MSVCCECCMLSGRGLYDETDRSSRGVLPTVTHRCVRSRNWRNEEAIARVGPQHHRKEKILLWVLNVTGHGDIHNLGELKCFCIPIGP